MNSILTKREAADRLRVCERTVDRYVKEGRLRAFRLGRRSVRLHAADVEALLSSPPVGGR